MKGEHGPAVALDRTRGPHEGACVATGVYYCCSVNTPQTCGALFMDIALYHALNGIAGHATWLDTILKDAATYLPAVLVVMVAGAWFWPGSLPDREARERLALYAVAGTLIGLAVAQVVGHLWFRDRPYVGHSAHLLLNPSADPSFPSDHAVGGFGLAMPFVFARHRLGRWLLALATLLALVRVTAGTHYPSDVLGGAMIGTGASWLVWRYRAAVDRPLETILTLMRHLHLA